MIILQQARGNLSSGDRLALDLPFSVTKSLTARIGPTPTFTRASEATFIGSDGLIKTAATNIPRFDHDPLTLACKGLLMEEGRTNLLFPSAILSTQTRTVTAVAHTLSFYGSGTIVLSGTHSATVVGTGAYPARRTITFTPTAGSLTLTVTGTVEFAQLESGSFATSYIPTTTASAVRSADVCSITGAAFSGMWNASEGTMFTHTQKTVGAGNSFVFHISDTTFSNDFSHRCGTTGIAASMNVSNIAQFTGFELTYASGSVAKAATAIRSNDCAFSANAGSVISDLLVSLPTVNRMFIGSAFTSSNHLNGTISAIRYYRRRLSNAKLQALTA